jgi:hypothetical protein
MASLRGCAEVECACRCTRDAAKQSEQARARLEVSERFELCSKRKKRSFLRYDRNQSHPQKREKERTWARNGPALCEVRWVLPPLATLRSYRCLCDASTDSVKPNPGTLRKPCVRSGFGETGWLLGCGATALPRQRQQPRRVLCEELR